MLSRTSDARLTRGPSAGLVQAFALGADRNHVADLHVGPQPLQLMQPGHLLVRQPVAGALHFHQLEDRFREPPVRPATAVFSVPLSKRPALPQLWTHTCKADTRDTQRKRSLLWEPDSSSRRTKRDGNGCRACCGGSDPSSPSVTLPSSPAPRWDPGGRKAGPR